jgi:hypothetical protein
MFAAVAAAVAGKLNSVRPVRPSTTTWTRYSAYSVIPAASRPIASCASKNSGAASRRATQRASSDSASTIVKDASR